MGARDSSWSAPIVGFRNMLQMTTDLCQPDEQLVMVNGKPGHRIWVDAECMVHFDVRLNEDCANRVE